MNRLHKAIERDVYSILGEFRYELLDRETRGAIEQRIGQCLYEYTIFAPPDYTVICDESNNTPDVIDRHKVRVSLILWGERLDFEYPEGGQ